MSALVNGFVFRIPNKVFTVLMILNRRHWICWYKLWLVLRTKHFILIFPWNWKETNMQITAKRKTYFFYPCLGKDLGKNFIILFCKTGESLNLRYVNFHPDFLIRFGISFRYYLLNIIVLNQFKLAKSEAYSRKPKQHV